MAKKKITDEERRSLIVQMNQDLDDFIAERSAIYKQEKANQGPEKEQTIDEIAEELKRHPAFMKEFDPTAEMSPEMEGLQKMKYESDSAEDNASSFKDDGNYNFKKKKYRWAIDVYSQGIKEKCASKELNAILYCNRAAAQYHLGNYRSSLHDAIISRKFKPDHMKAILRGIQCCMELKKFDYVMKWCDEALSLEPTDEMFLDLRSKGDKLKRQKERDERRQAVKERKEQMEEDALVKSIQDRGIKLSGAKDSASHSVLRSLESHHPSGAKVTVGTDGALSWPVMFVYPEYGQTDFIEAFQEHTRFLDHVESMFGAGLPPAPWDEDRKYKPDKIVIYFEDRDKEEIFQVNTQSTLSEVLKHERYVVYGGTPTFIFFVSGSPFSKEFLRKYKL